MTLPSSDSASSQAMRVSRRGLGRRMGGFPFRLARRAPSPLPSLRLSSGVMLMLLTLTTLVAAVSAAPQIAAAATLQTPPPATPTAPAAPAPEPATQDPAPPAEPSAAQDPAAPAKRDKDAPVTVRGCLAGVMLGHVESDEEIARLTPTLRLLSKKEIKKRIKSMDGYMVEATGLLKLPPKSPLSRTIGNTTVSVGLGDPRAPQNQPMYRQQIDYGTLDVTEITSLSTRCGLKR